LTAVQWFQLYLQGKSWRGIARRLVEIKQVYRLREKLVTMQCVFCSKINLNLSVMARDSLQEYSFGLNQQWQQYGEIDSTMPGD